jgi:hypothetical protein
MKSACRGGADIARMRIQERKRPVEDLGRTRLDRHWPPFHDAELSRYDAPSRAWEACVTRRGFIAWPAEQRRGPPTEQPS